MLAEIGNCGWIILGLEDELLATLDQDCHLSACIFIAQALIVGKDPEAFAPIGTLIPLKALEPSLL